MLKFIRTFLALINAVIIVALLSIHFIIKDRDYSTSLWFYAFPLPVIITIILLLSLVLKKQLKRINFLLVIVLLVVWFARSFKINFNEDPQGDVVEVVFWNAGHFRTFEEAFQVNKSVPDIVVLGEYHGDYFEETKLKYPQYYFYMNTNEEIGVFSRDPIEIIKETPSKYGSVVIEFQTSGIRFFAVDVSASIDVPRDWELGFVEETIYSNKNTVILGDFNVPYESSLLDKIKSKFSHAFNEKGNGFRETWAFNIPLLSLDHIWVSNDLEIVNTEKRNTLKSDHAMIKTELLR